MSQYDKLPEKSRGAQSNPNSCLVTCKGETSSKYRYQGKFSMLVQQVETDHILYNLALYHLSCFYEVMS